MAFRVAVPCWISFFGAIVQCTIKTHVRTSMEYLANDRFAQVVFAEVFFS